MHDLGALKRNFVFEALFLTLGQKTVEGCLPRQRSEHNTNTVNGADVKTG
jgi:hypothetical protein